jgi:hypothetical protein
MDAAGVLVAKTKFMLPIGREIADVIDVAKFVNFKTRPRRGNPVTGIIGIGHGAGSTIGGLWLRACDGGNHFVTPQD